MLGFLAWPRDRAGGAGGAPLQASVLGWLGTGPLNLVMFLVTFPAGGALDSQLCVLFSWVFFTPWLLGKKPLQSGH